MNNAVCIISAIASNYGHFTYDERYSQLLETIDSIKQYLPNSDIFLFDTSDDPILPEHVLELNQRVYKAFILENDMVISNMKKAYKDIDANLLHKKTVGELRAMVIMTQILSTQPKKYETVFKISGRYKLNGKFNENRFKQDAIVTGNITMWFDEYIMPIRLWAFPFKEIEGLKNTFNFLYNSTLNALITEEKLEVIEFSFLRFARENHIPHIQLEVLGLEGPKGLDGYIIYE